MLHHRPLLPFVLGGLLVATVLGGCAGAALTIPPGSAGQSNPPPPPPSDSPAPLRIEHKTGAADVVLRYGVAGGFIAPGALVTEAPTFSLFGDGTAIYRDQSQNPPPPDGSLFRALPFRTAKLTEDQVQALLDFAINQGGLGIARALYQRPIADVGSATFELHAGGLDKTVTVVGLGIDDETGPDQAARQAFKVLADRLSVFDFAYSLNSTVYEPARYRAVLMPLDVPQGSPSPVAWPWPNLTPADFTPPADPNAPSFPRHTLSPGEVDALRLDNIAGGFMGLPLGGPDGKGLYSLGLRPLLPDEKD